MGNVIAYLKKIAGFFSFCIFFFCHLSLADPLFSIDLNNAHGTFAVSSRGVIQVTYTLHNRHIGLLSDLSFRTSPLSHIDPVGTTCRENLAQGQTCQLRLSVGPANGVGELTLSPLTVCAFKGACCIAATLPNRIHITFGTALAYVLIDATENNLNIINTATQKVIRRLTLTSAKPKDIAIGGDGCLYVTIPSEKAVRMINHLNIISDPISMGSRGANFIRMTPDKTKAYVSNAESNKMGVIDLMKNQLVSPLKNVFSRRLKDFLITPHDTYIGGIRHFGFLKNNGRLGIIVRNHRVKSLAFLPRQNLVYAAVPTDNELLLVKEAAIAGTVTLPTSPQYVTVAPDHHRVYVLVNGPQVFVIDPNKRNAVIKKIALPSGRASAPQSMRVTPDSRWIYVVCADGVRVIDALKYTVFDPIILSGPPTGGIVISP